MSTENQGALLPAMMDLARQAGDILLGHFGKVHIEYKSVADLVTAADRESEAFLVARIREQFPSHDLVAEEGSRSETGSPYRWYIDPLDGTTNFAHGLPLFAVSLGVEHRGRMIAGVVYNPVMNELFAAAEGQGATLNGKAIHVSQTPELLASLLATGFPTQKRHSNPNIHFYHCLTMRTHGVRRLGSAALDLCFVACGRFEAFWEFNLKPWDTAAGSLILREAGGRITDMMGGEFHLDGPEVLGSNGKVHQELQDLFAEIFAGKVPELPSAQDYSRLRAQSQGR